MSNTLQVLEDKKILTIVERHHKPKLNISMTSIAMLSQYSRTGSLTCVVNRDIIMNETTKIKVYALQGPSV